jgi:hypothetical protein
VVKFATSDGMVMVSVKVSVSNFEGIHWIKLALAPRLGLTRIIHLI